MRRVPLLLALLALPAGPARAGEEEEKAVAAVEKTGARVRRDAKQAGKPVVAVYFKGEVSDDDLKHLAALKDLEYVQFFNVYSLTGAGLRHLKGLPKLNTLGIQFTTLKSEETYTHLKELRQLQHVEVGYTTIAEKREAWPRIQSILPDAQLGSRVGDSLLDKRPTPPSAKILQAWLDAGATFSQLDGGLPNLKLGPLAMKTIKKMPDPEVAFSLSLSAGRREVEAALPALKRFKTLAGLRLATPLNYGLGVDLAELDNLGQLRELDLRGSSIYPDRKSAQTLEHLKSLKKLEALEALSLNCITLHEREDLGMLAELKELRVIRLSFQVARQRWTGADLEILARLPHLEEVQLDGANLTAGDLKTLASAKNLRRLNLSGCQVPEAALGGLAELKELRELDFSGNKITDAGLRELAKCTGLG